MAGAFKRAGHERGGLQQVAVELALLGLARASAAGGCHGRGDGAVLARRKTWQLVAALAGYDGPLPYPTALLESSAREARFYRLYPDRRRYDEWILEMHIGVERPASGEAWALTAFDAA